MGCTQQGPSTCSGTSCTHALLHTHAQRETQTRGSHSIEHISSQGCDFDNLFTSGVRVSVAVRPLAVTPTPT